MTAEVAPPAWDPVGPSPASGERRRRLEVAVGAACPPLVERVDPLADALSSAYAACRDKVDVFDPARARCDPVGTPTALGLRSTLWEPLEAALADEVARAATHRADGVERRLEAALDADATVSVDVDTGGFPGRYAHRALDRLLVAAETVAVRRLRTTRAEAADPRRAATVAFDDLVATEPRRIAAAALLLADRAGVQALATATGAVTAKRWVQSNDVPCPIHDGVDGATVPVDRCFAVDVGHVRCSAFLPGENFPLACTCRLRAIVGDVPHAAPRALAVREGVSVRLDGDTVTSLSDRQHEVYQEHARPDESFPALLGRVHEEHSVRGGARALGVAKKTLYRWFDAYIDGFDRYSGR